MPKGVGIPGVSRKLNKAGVNEVVIYARLILLTRQHHDLELLVSRCSTESHIFVVTYGRVHSKSKGCAPTDCSLCLGKQMLSISSLRKRTK